MSAAAFDRRIDGVVLAAGLGLALLAAAASCALAYRIRHTAPEAASAAHLAVGTASLTVPRDWVIAPSGSGPASLAIPAAQILGSASPAHRVLVQVASVEEDRTASPVQLYARFLARETTPIAGGLLRRDFVPGSPFEGEALYLAPPDGRAWAARCLEGASAAGVEAGCLTEMRLGQVRLQVSFAPALLSRGPALAAGLRRLFASLEHGSATASH